MDEDDLRYCGLLLNYYFIIFIILLIIVKLSIKQYLFVHNACNVQVSVAHLLKYITAAKQVLQGNK